MFWGPSTKLVILLLSVCLSALTISQPQKWSNILCAFVLSGAYLRLQMWSKSMINQGFLWFCQSWPLILSLVSWLMALCSSDAAVPMVGPSVFLTPAQLLSQLGNAYRVGGHSPHSGCQCVVAFRHCSVLFCGKYDWAVPGTALAHATSLWKGGPYITRPGSGWFEHDYVASRHILLLTHHIWSVLLSEWCAVCVVRSNRGAFEASICGQTSSGMQQNDLPGIRCLLCSPSVCCLSITPTLMVHQWTIGVGKGPSGSGHLQSVMVYPFPGGDWIWQFKLAALESIG